MPATILDALDLFSIIVDQVAFHPGNPALNTGVVTVGLLPLTVGSTKTFQANVKLNGLPWSLVGGSASLVLSDPGGNKTTIAGTISGATVTAPWTVVGPAGNWLRSWTLQDASGVKQISNPSAFTVISSPS